MGSSPAADDTDRYQDELWKHPTHAKLLVSDADAGRVIGRRGSAVAGVESTSGAQVRLSRRGQFLPGTDSRVLLVSGLFHQVMDAAQLILEKIIYQGDKVIDDRATVVLVLPDACCGALIGKGGTVIKSLAMASNAGIVISPQDICYGLNDRLVTITGHLDNQLQAIFLILSELLEDDRYSCSYAGELWKHPTHATLLVSDADAGRVIGRRGSTVAGVESTSGAQVRLSRRGQFLLGTDSRVLLVSGLFHQVMDAAELLLEKIIYKGDQVIDDRATVVLVVPDACCGTLIGKGGTVIKSLAIASNAGIVVSPQDVCYGLNDRLVTITGHLDNQLQAIFLILSKLLEDDGYSCSYAGVPFPYPVSSVGLQDHGPDEHVERYHSRPKTPMRSPDNNDDDAQESISESCTEYDEPDIEDGEDAYFKGLVDRFIAAAYPSGMNGVVATGPEQQDVVTTPGASTRSMEAQAARRMAELEGAEAVVSAGNGADSASLGAKTEIIRMLLRERWTWKYHTTQDGPNGLVVLSIIKKQPTKDSCLPTAVAAVMESNLRVQVNKDTLLSLEHLIHLAILGRLKFPNEKVAPNRLIFMARDEGVLSEKDFEKSKTATGSGFVRYRITENFCYKLKKPSQMKHALHRMRSRGPLLGIINISKNYDECAKSGEIYKYDPNLVEKDDKGNPIVLTHAVCVISFAIENGVPYLECQDSHGERYNKGFLKIDVTSLTHLWSIVVALTDVCGVVV